PPIGLVAVASPRERAGARAKGERNESGEVVEPLLFPAREDERTAGSRLERGAKAHAERLRNRVHRIPEAGHEERRGAVEGRFVSALRLHEQVADEVAPIFPLEVARQEKEGAGVVLLVERGAPAVPCGDG